MKPIGDEIFLSANPNPFKNSCTVTATMPAKGRLILNTIEGLKIRNYDLNSGENKFDIYGDALGNAGTYIVIVICDNGKTAVQKITFVK